MKTMSDRFANLGPLGFHLTNPLKYIFMVHHSDVMKECISLMRSDWVEAVLKEEQAVMLRSANLGRSLTKVCALFMYSGGIFFQAMTIFKPTEIDEFNITIRQHVLPRYDYFVDSQISPVFEIVYGIHVFCGLFLYTIEIATCNLAGVFVGHVCGQVQVMRLKLATLENLTNLGNDREIDDSIASVIHCHMTSEWCRFAGNIRKALREICLVEVIYSTVAMCWLEFFCLNEWSNSEILSLVTYIMTFISLTFNIFILCYIGEILKNQCESVAQLTYAIDWYKVSQRKLLSFILIIAMAKYPRNITAGGMLDLTLRSFGDVLKTSLAYFQMLRTITM
nr:PREDICTED: odorant receptor 13a-like [Fopius arisanus]